MNQTYPIDILSAEEIAKGIPERVYIVGSGPNGRDYWQRIPSNAQVIVVNRAIMIRGIPKTWWLCEDDTLPDQEWFVKCVEKFDFHNVEIPRFIFRHGGSLHKKYPSKYVFTHKAIWDTACCKHAGEPKFQPPFTYGGATISCRAVQIAALRGAKEIILVGVDMGGSFHFDGTEGECQKDIRREGKWMQAERFDQIIRWLKRNTGCEIFTLSKTELKEPLPLYK